MLMETPSALADTRDSACAQLPTNAWSQFLRLVQDGVLGQAELPPGKAIRELCGEGALVTLALDPEQRFAAFRRSGLPGDSARPEPGWLEIELFWCPVDADQGVGGYKCRALGEAAWQWLLHWQQTWRHFVAKVVGKPLQASWGALPCMTQAVATWAAQGGVQMDLALLDELRAAAETSKSELEYQQQLNAEQRQALKELRGEVHRLTTALDNRFTARGDEEADEEVESKGPLTGGKWDDLSHLEAWAALNEERIAITSRAFNGAKKSDYIYPDHVRLALEFLAGPYRDSRLGLIDNDQLEGALAEAGLRMSGSTSLTVAGEQGDAYYVSWHGHRTFLNMHLVRGGGRETRYCLRVYFFWCERTQRAVVGWLPSHLANSLT